MLHNKIGTVRSMQFGAKVRKKDLENFQKGDNWSGSKFENLEVTNMDIGLSDMPGLIKQNLKGRKLRSPDADLPVLAFDGVKFESNSNSPTYLWYGHSVLLLRMHGLNFLIDPMFGDNASPIAPITTKRFSAGTIHIIDSLPPIDAVLITHDHYDHLDYGSIQKLREKIDTWFVGLGIARHLVRWGIPEEKITEFNWWDSNEFKDVEITYTPSRHFSGRGAFDRAKSLWGGWAFKSSTDNLLWSGDGGYGKHFAEIGERLGPFDHAFMECGQYNELWHQIHMYPEEAVQAAQDVGAPSAIPVHWGGFTLALHHWKEPIQRFTAEAQRVGFDICTPRLGEVVDLGGALPIEPWWDLV